MEHLQDKNMIKRFIECLTHREVSEDYYIFQQNDKPDGLYFVESGRLSVLITTEDGSTIRLRTMTCFSFNFFYLHLTNRIV